jgi:hypothetical protein
MVKNLNQTISIAKHIVDGYTRDVSIGGMCIVLDPRYAHVPAMYQDIKAVHIQISMPDAVR